jgi:hypothetical protein
MGQHISDDNTIQKVKTRGRLFAGALPALGKLCCCAKCKCLDNEQVSSFQFRV